MKRFGFGMKSQLGQNILSGHFPKNDVDGDCYVDLLDFSLLQSRNRVGVHETDAKSGQDFFFLDRFRRGFRFFESGR